MQSMPRTDFTADQLLAMPRGQSRCELVRGELRAMSPAGWLHGAGPGAGSSPQLATSVTSATAHTAATTRNRNTTATDTPSSQS